MKRHLGKSGPKQGPNGKIRPPLILQLDLGLFVLFPLTRPDLNEITFDVNEK